MNNRLDLISSDFLALDVLLGLLGGELGRGTHRAVFAAGWSDDYVIKIEVGAAGANGREWEVWKELSGTPAEKWLCPCVLISPGTTALVMRRAQPITDVSVLPKRLPWWVTDVKAENWGLLDGRPVLVDYANHRFFSRGLGRDRRVKRWHKVDHADIHTTPPLRVTKRRS